MELNYNMTGEERKRLVRAISAYTGAEARYLYAPSFAYEVDCFTIDKNGVVSFDDRTDSELVEGLIEALVQQGFVAQPHNTCFESAPLESPNAENSANAEQVSTEEGCRGMDADISAETVLDKAEAAAEGELDEGNKNAVDSSDDCGLTISLPMEGFTETSLENLRKLVEAKASLIKKALNADRLDIVTSETKISFPWFDVLPRPEETQDYTNFLAALCQMAKNTKRVTATDKRVENEKYSFRCFLLRLGFIGAENKVPRKILLRRLSGSSAFPSKEKADAFSAAQKARRMARKEAEEA